MKETFTPSKMAKRIPQPNDKQLETLIANSSLLPLMSNRKWVKLLDALVAHASEVKECRVKLVWEPENKVRQLFIDEFTQYNFDYYRQAMESMVSGQPGGWYAYREIEWLEFPRLAANHASRPPGWLEVQNLELLQRGSARCRKISRQPDRR